MNINKDYYAILGVLPSAEIVVIKAAYKALSKRYHPDVYSGHNAAEKMSDINEAYEVLSNESAKREYDEARGTRNQDGEEYFNDDFGTHETVDPLDAHWSIAVKYHPNLDIAVQQLARISKKLAYGFKAYMLETKDFDNSDSIARKLELAFLHQYFGSDYDIMEFTEDLISDGRKDILRELNKAVKVLGVSNADSRLIDKIKQEFAYKTRKERFPESMYNIGITAATLTKLTKDQKQDLFETWKSNPDLASDDAWAIVAASNAANKEKQASAEKEVMVGVIKAVFTIFVLFLCIWVLFHSL